MEVQADVTSTQRFSFCSESATSLSEKSVNVSIAPDDGTASTRALAGSVLNMKLDGVSLAGGKSLEGESTAVVVSAQNDSSGQATSLSSLEDMTAANLAKRARRRPPIDKQSSGDLVVTEDGISERVRFDHHVSFIDINQESGRSATRRKRKDADLPKSQRFVDRFVK